MLVVPSMMPAVLGMQARSGSSQGAAALRVLLSDSTSGELIISSCTPDQLWAALCGRPPQEQLRPEDVLAEERQQPCEPASRGQITVQVGLQATCEAA